MSTPAKSGHGYNLYFLIFKPSIPWVSDPSWIQEPDQLSMVPVLYFILFTLIYKVLEFVPSSMIEAMKD